MPIVAMCYIDDRVFISMGRGASGGQMAAAGDLVFFERRAPDMIWDLEHRRNVYYETNGSMTAINAMLAAVTNRLWLAMRNQMIIFNPNTLMKEVSLFAF